MAGVSQLENPWGHAPANPTVIRSNVTLLGTVFAAAFGMQLAFDTGSERIWDNINRGRQWKDIKQRYIEAAEDDE
ncbi:qcr9 subunit 9 of the ubiquinol cytochrome-c reductase complex [Ascochyta rabiei]|uniref:qcr9 subunit 9 of the ubiquinol cytochrome-c reductase complex n=1 Tax=Didymella rabiei TaxID=5454 RepID=UPI00190163BE|nr:qcr9 subunit 9 of the ubiquinol cytochrome-c reductase complex [Ascochyta rabiei]UPX09613.1 qcr9 subunit 9 of the ubiquinol cytochrome-c reductase complex [Ascochyta rabiei]